VIAGTAASLELSCRRVVEHVGDRREEMLAVAPAGPAAVGTANVAADQA